ncbi:hypothetical protein RSO41_13530 [Halomonas sp. I1]|uniref:hypothetical protein n=1 Tax=Halomonas sp. I1 TaxID=393536 RepID=UPI0028DDB7AD|nr:hypothetical protein [Halomonas sp. I1]MDT8895673.1 hypothetical protein [Halomonas sp. I1]
MTKRYFKITKLLPGNPLHDEQGYTDPIEAMKAHLRQKQAFHNSASELAKQFGGVAVNSTGMTRVSLHGVYFDREPDHPELWTKPDPKARFSRRPRAKGARNVKGDELKQAHKELLDRWSKETPEPLELDGQWLCGGYATADLMFSGAGMVVDLEKGELYVAAGQPPERGAEFVEVAGGEYQQAEAATSNQKAADYL